MRFTGAVGGRGQVEFSPAVVSGRARSGPLRPGAGAGVSTERTRAAGSGAGRAWLRALAAAGPWLRCLAGRCRGSGSSRAGAHGPGGSGSSHPSPVPARLARRSAVAGRSRAGGGWFRRLAASLLVALAASAFGAPALAQTHCDSSDPLELWCATLTVGTTSQSGFTYTGYAIADNDNSIPAFGSIAPNTFTYRTATISVDILEYEGNSVSFEIARSSGTTPADGLLGPDTFTLEIGTGGTKNSFAIVNPGTTIYFEFPDPGLSWSVGDTVPVKLVRTNAAPTVATVIPDQTATAGTAFSYAFPDTTFSDADSDTLTYTATKADGTALPPWLSFTAGTRTFSGTPQAADVATVSVKVTASDGSASVSDTFDIVVSAAPSLGTTCNAPDLAGRTQIWTNTLNVGGPDTADAYGFQPTLDNPGTFTDPSNVSISYESNPYVINSILVRADARLDVFFNTALPSALKAKLAFHVCDEQFAFTDAPYNAVSFLHRYRWTSTGLDWSSESTRTLYLSVLGTTNTAPTAADGTVTARPNTNYSFSASNFNSMDADNDALSSVKIVTLPATGKGTLSLSGTAITTGDLPKTVTASDLSARRLKYAPPSGESGSALASFTYKVNDGRSDSTAAFTMTINVGQNTAPTSANNTVMTRQDAEYRFFISDFNYGDADGNWIWSVKIVTLPSAGTLRHDDTDVSAGYAMHRSDLGRQALRYVPPSGQSGAGLGSFTFKVNDGISDSNATYTMTIDVSASASAQPETAHCTNDPLELWCATVTVGTGDHYSGYGVLGSYGAIAPSNRFRNGSHIVRVDRLSHGGSSNALYLWFASSSGWVPNGLLGTGNFTLEFGTGLSKEVRVHHQPGESQEFQIHQPRPAQLVNGRHGPGQAPQGDGNAGRSRSANCDEHSRSERWRVPTGNGPKARRSRSRSLSARRSRWTPPGAHLRSRSGSTARRCEEQRICAAAARRSWCSATRWSRATAPTP